MLISRFRGRQQRLLALYGAFRQAGTRAQHPHMLARETGLSLTEVARLLDETPELFVRLPTKPGASRRYRLATSMTARTPTDVANYIRGRARAELYGQAAIALIALLASAVLLLSIAPWAISVSQQSDDPTGSAAPSTR